MVRRSGAGSGGGLVTAIHPQRSEGDDGQVGREGGRARAASGLASRGHLTGWHGLVTALLRNHYPQEIVARGIARHTR
ncbi:hypothetical protein BST61_g3308 [Cercospora zeina]